jgi:hypothetical protein
MTPQERYQRDVEFRVLVDMIESMVSHCKYTPTELREAVILASIHHDIRNPSPIFLTISEYRNHINILEEELKHLRPDVGPINKMTKDLK